MKSLMLILMVIAFTFAHADETKKSFTVTPQTGIAPEEVTLNAEGIHQHAEIFIWNFGNGETLTTTNPKINYTFKTAGTFAVQLKYLKNKQDKLDKGKDGGSATVVIHPNKLPLPVLSCQSSAINKIECSALGSRDEDGTIVSYKYDWGDENSKSVTTPETVDYFYAEGGIKNVRLTITDNKGGVSTIEKEVTVKRNTPPVADFICQKTGYQKVHCESTATDIDEELSNFKWTLDDGSSYTTKSFDHKFSRPMDVAISSHAITLAVTDSYQATASVTKNVEVDLEPIRQAPRGYFKIYQNGTTTVDLRSFVVKTQFDIKRAYYQVYGTGAEPLQVIELSEFYANTSIKVNLPAFGGNRIFLNIIDYRDQLIRYSVPFSLVQDTVTLKPHVEFRAIQSAPKTAYINLNPSFDFDEDFTIRTFIVKFGDGEQQEISNETFLTHEYAEAGNYTITVTAKTNHGTENTLSKVLTVTDAGVAPTIPDPTFSYRIYDYAQNVSFYDERSGTPNGEIISYQWEFGDGSVGYGKTQAHFYDPGTYIVKLTVTDTMGYSSFQFQKIVVTAEGEDVLARIDCSLQSPFLDFAQKCKVTALDRLNDISRVRVIWGDGTVYTLATPFDANQGTYYPTKQYTAAGTYTIRAVVNTNRGVTRSHEITRTIIARPPVANIQCFPNNLAVFCDALGSYDPKGTALTYEFNFGNGVTETNTTGVVTYAYPDAGLFDVSVKVTDAKGMTANAVTKVQVVRPPNVLPLADFSCDSPEPLTLYCWENGISDPDGFVVSKKLSFDDGDSGFLNPENPTRKQFTTDGQHEVTLTVMDNDGGVTTVTKSFAVKVNNPPIADFECTTPGPQRLSCYSTSSDPDQWDFPVKFAWEFGDNGGLSGLEGWFDHTYNFSGAVQVKLTVEDKYGLKSTAIKNFTLLENQAPSIQAYCQSNQPQTASCFATAYDPEGQTFTIDWNADGKNYNGWEISATFNDSGMKNVEVIATDILGASTRIDVPVLVMANTPPFAIAECEYISESSSFYCKSKSYDPDGLIVSSKWLFNDGTEFNGVSFVHNFSGQNSIGYSLEVTDNLGLKTSYLGTLVLPEVLANSDYSDENCGFQENTQNKLCADEYFVANNDSELNDYLLNGKFDDGKLLNLEIAYNVVSPELKISTGCDIRINEDVKLNSSKGICLQGNKVEFRGRNNLQDNSIKGIKILTSENALLKSVMLQSEGEIRIESFQFDPFENGIVIDEKSHIKSKVTRLITSSHLTISEDSILEVDSIIGNGGQCQLNGHVMNGGNCDLNSIETISDISSENVDQKLKLNIVHENENISKYFWKMNGRVVESIGSEYLYESRIIGDFYVDVAIVDEQGFFQTFKKRVINDNLNFKRDAYVIVNSEGYNSSEENRKILINGQEHKLYKANGENLYTFLLDETIPLGEALISLPSSNFSGKIIIKENLGSFDDVEKVFNALYDKFERENTSNNPEITRILEQYKQNVISINQALLSLSEEERVEFAKNFLANVDFREENYSTVNLDKLFDPLFIPSAHAQLQPFIDWLSPSSLKKFTASSIGIGFQTGLCAIGGLVGVAIGDFSKKAVLYSSAGTLICITFSMIAVANSTELLEDAHLIQKGSLTLNSNLKTIKSRVEQNLRITSQYIPVNSVSNNSTLVKSAKDEVDKINGSVEVINNSIRELNSTIGLVGLDPFEEIPKVTFAQTSFRGEISSSFIESVKIIKPVDGTAKILSQNKTNDGYIIKFFSKKTQNIQISIIYNNKELGIREIVDDTIKIEADGPKAEFTENEFRKKVNFNAYNEFNSNMNNLKYIWDFGDNKSITTDQAVVDHTYSEVGTYLVKLKVENEEGVYDEFSKNVEVTNSLSFFVSINPQGTYLFTDTAYGHETDDENHIPDIAVPPSSFNLSSLYNDPEINLKAGDVIEIQQIGAMQPGIDEDWSDNLTGVGAVFSGSGGFLFPGILGNFMPIYTPSTCTAGIPTDIPQDFGLFNGTTITVQVPEGADRILFTPNDCFFKDNKDPNGDFGVKIKITIYRTNNM